LQRLARNPTSAAIFCSVVFLLIIRNWTSRGAVPTIALLPITNQQFRRLGFGHDSVRLLKTRISALPSPFYNHLHIKLLDHQHKFHRSINQTKDSEFYSRDRFLLLDDIDDDEDDVQTSRYDHDNELHRPLKCERTNWRTSPKLNCNTVHELVLSTSAKFLGRGHYRNAWLYPDKDNDVVLKQMRLPETEDDYEHLPNYESFLKIQYEAIIMERLTAAPTIVTSYGNCGTTILAESCPTEVVHLILPGTGYVKNATRVSQNNLSLQEKLQMALSMAEGLAELHGFSGGVIVHGDIHPVQYLKNKDGVIKLNDFNNAELLDWNIETNADYCKVNRGTWMGNVSEGCSLSDRSMLSCC
jgi:hypothetical protein